mgnify:CR=1 FL=1
MENPRELGKDAETRAEALLRHAGLHPVARNYRCRGGEIDLVMRDDDHMVFVEVRSRSHGGFGGAAASIGPGKQQRLILAAQHYLMSSGWSGPCRFDVVAFEQGHEGRWIKDAFGT